VAARSRSGRWRVYWVLLLLTLLAFIAGTRAPIVFVAYAALVEAAGIYLVLSGGGVWRRQSPQAAPPGAFRLIGLMTMAAGTGLPALFIIRTGLSTDPLIEALLYGSAVVLTGSLIVMSVRYRDFFNADN
jgi:hypothetical protein